MCGGDLDIRWINDFRFYGDNTEFGGPYRDGETILGGQLLTYFEVPVGEKTSILAGGYGDFRSGDDEHPHDSEPILSFRYRTGDRSRFILGTLETVRRHGLIDPLEVSTLELTRPVESGVQFTTVRDRWQGDFFINWQKLNTPEHREAFDYGLAASWNAGAGVSLLAQVHGYHEGGQLYDVGEVYNNSVLAPGASYARALPWLGESAVRAFYLHSSTTRSHAYPERPEDGGGVWLELSAKPWERSRLFAIYWRGSDFYAREGDPNYGSVGTDPSYYRADRTYKELGGEYSFPIENGLTFTAEARLHWIDTRQTEYSWRLYARVPMEFVVMRR